MELLFSFGKSQQRLDLLDSNFARVMKGGERIAFPLDEHGPRSPSLGAPISASGLWASIRPTLGPFLWKHSAIEAVI